MHDNQPEDIEGSELSPRDDPYTLPPLRAPQSIDGEPHEALDAALAEFEAVLGDLHTYAGKVELLTRSAMFSEALTVPDEFLPGTGVPGYPDSTYEVEGARRVARSLLAAQVLVGQVRAELAKPVAESRRMV